MTELNWVQRFAIIDHFKISDDLLICKVFNITPNALKSAQLMKSLGYFSSDPGKINYNDYASQFGTASVKEENSTTPPKAKKHSAPKAKKTTAKPGPKGRKIRDAYEDIPRETEAIPVEDFMKKHNVSLSVLRRHSHFDHIPETGKVTVRQKTLTIDGKSEKVLCIWRLLPK